MNEIKRVLLNKRIIISFLLLIVITTGFYLNTQYQNAKQSGADIFETTAYRNEVLKSLYGKSVSDMQENINAQLDYVSTICELMNYDFLKAEDYQFYVDVWQEQEIELRSSHPDTAMEYDENKNTYDMQKYKAKENVLTEISRQVEYIAEYPNYLESIDRQAEQMNTISIFSATDSLSSKNINQTVKDYAPLKEISLSIDNDKPLTTILGFDLIHYLIFAFTIIVVFGFIEERKKGLWNVVYSTPNGRFVLAVKRAGILCISVAFATAVMYFVLFSVSFLLYGGWGDVFREVQSIEMFRNFIFPMSEIQFIIFYIFANIITQLALAFLFLFIVSFIQNTSIALGTAGIVFAAEFAFYAFLPIQSNISIIKCLNVFYFINPTEAIIRYCNLNVFFFIINLYWLVVLSAVLLIFVFAFFSIITSANKYPGKTPNRIEIFLVKLFGKITSVYWKAVEKLTITGTELYKILIIQKGWIALAVFAFVLFNSIDTNELYYSGADSVVNSFYQSYSGPLIDETLQYVSDLENEIAEVDNQLVKAYEDYTTGAISYDEYTKAVFKSEAYDNKREALKIIQERMEYIEQNELNGMQVWLVNPNGYNNLLYADGFARQQNYALFSVFCIIIVMSGIFSFEKRSNMYNSLMASYRGRQYLFGKKIISATILTVLIWLCTYGAEIFDVCLKYPLDNFNAPVKSLEFLNDLPFNCSIGVFLALVYGLRLLLLLSVSYIVCLISALTKFEITIIISAVVLMVPSLLYVVGIDIFSYVSVIVPVSAMNLIISSEGITFLIPYFLMTVFGLAAIIFARRKWCKESRVKQK